MAGTEASSSREQIFDELLGSLNSVDPLESILTRAAQLCGGAGLAVNDLGEVIRSVGSAPSHLISQWVHAEVMAGEAAAAQTEAADGAEALGGRIGRWTVRARTVRMRHRSHALVIASHEDAEAGESRRSPRADVGRVLDTAVKLLRAFEGFESFSLSNRREESARVLRDLEVGVSPAREPAIWRSLENFGFAAYEPVRIVRIRRKPDEVGARREPPPPGHGLLISESGHVASFAEQTALCRADFDVEASFATSDVIGVGISGPFTALSHVPEMLRSADVALASARESRVVAVDEMRPIEWAAARMNSRFDRDLVRRFLEPIASNPEAWATVIAYVDSGAVIAEAARRLQVHENTVRYRLAQIEKVYGARITHPRLIAEVVLALECRRAEETVVK